MECRYQEEFKQNNKFWCKAPCLWYTVETGGSAREVRRGRVSIRDHPANLTFTVTLESLREEDAGTYGCGIDMPLSLDPTLKVEVSVTPGEHPPPSLLHQAGHPDPQEGSGPEKLGQDDPEGVGREPGSGCCLGMYLFAHMHVSVSKWRHSCTFLLHRLAGIPFGVQAACCPHKGTSTLKRPVSFWPVQGPAYRGHTLTRPHCIQAGLDPGALRT